MEMSHLDAIRTKCEKILGNTVHIIGYHTVSHIQDIRGGTIILIQNDSLVRSEIHKTMRFRTAPLINALVRVADYEQVLVELGKLLDNLPVVRVAILRLIHHYIIQLILPVLTRIRKPVQNILCKIFNVIEVQCKVFQLTRNETGQFRLLHLVRNLRAWDHVCRDVVIH